MKAGVHVAEILLQTVVKRLILVKVFQLLPLVDDEHDGVGRQQPTVFGEEDEEQPVEELLRFLEEQDLMFRVVGGVVLQDVFKEVALEVRVVFIEGVGYLVLVGEAGCLDLLGEVLGDVLVCQAYPEPGEVVAGEVEQIKLLEVDGVVDVEAQLLEVGDDDVEGFFVLALIVEGLCLDFAEVRRFVVFQLNHTHNLAIDEDGTIGLLAVGLVLLLGGEVEIGVGIQGVAENLHEQFAKETFLELLFLAVEDVGLPFRIQEEAGEGLVTLINQRVIKAFDVFVEDIALEDLHGDLRL